MPKPIPANQKLKQYLRQRQREVKRHAQGRIPHDYLVPGGPYEEQWDWDGFFIGLALLTDIPSEGIYLKNWVLNYIHNTDPKTGFTPGLLTPKGIDKRLNHVKPFLAQGALLSAQSLEDFSWLRPSFAKLEKITSYREKYCWHNELQLGVWYDSMESGIDNNIAVLNYPKKTVVGVDLNTYIYLEYLSLARIAIKLHKTKSSQKWQIKALHLKKNINKHLWDKATLSYFNYNTTTKSLIVRHTCSNLIPLYAKLATATQGKQLIKKYVLNSTYYWSAYGIRSLAKIDPSFNNRPIIKPHSNWQGPVWPLVNYLVTEALCNYGFESKAAQLAKKTIKLCLSDIGNSGGMHENYSSINGSGLAANNFISWNLLASNIQELANGKVKTLINRLKH